MLCLIYTHDCQRVLCTQGECGYIRLSTCACLHVCVSMCSCVCTFVCIVYSIPIHLYVALRFSRSYVFSGSSNTWLWEELAAHLVAPPYKPKLVSIPLPHHNNICLLISVYCHFYHTIIKALREFDL